MKAIKIGITITLLGLLMVGCKSDGGASSSQSPNDGKLSKTGSLEIPKRISAPIADTALETNVLNEIFAKLLEYSSIPDIATGYIPSMSENVLNSNYAYPQLAEQFGMSDRHSVRSQTQYSWLVSNGDHVNSYKDRFFKSTTEYPQSRLAYQMMQSCDLQVHTVDNLASGNNSPNDKSIVADKSIERVQGPNGKKDGLDKNKCLGELKEKLYVQTKDNLPDSEDTDTEGFQELTTDTLLNDFSSKGVFGYDWIEHKMSQKHRLVNKPGYLVLYVKGEGSFKIRNFRAISNDYVFEGTINFERLTHQPHFGDSHMKIDLTINLDVEAWSLHGETVKLTAWLARGQDSEFYVNGAPLTESTHIMAAKSIFEGLVGIPVLVNDIEPVPTY